VSCGFHGRPARIRNYALHYFRGGAWGTLRVMRKVPKRWFARVVLALSSSRWLRWGGISLVAAGVIGIVAQAFFMLMFGALPFQGFEFLYGTLLGVVFSVRDAVVPAIVAVGLIGVYALTARHSGRFRKLCGVGLGLVLVPALVLAGLNVYATFVAPRYIAYGPSQGVPVSHQIEHWVSWGWPIGAALLGVGVLGVRELGRWRALPLVLGLLSTPPVSFFLPYVASGGRPERGVEGAWTLVLDAEPVLLNLGWLLLGYGLLRARGAETISQRNTRLARRLYEEAWGKGELRVLDELVAPDVADHYYRQRGLENFKRSVASLRVSFPDLRFSLEGQEAEEDTVTTRWTASGTDRGGVLWYPPTGQAATFSGTFTDRFEGGRLVEHRGESDTPGLLRRLGLPPNG
jgi:predicted ester cyclase